MISEPAPRMIGMHSIRGADDQLAAAVLLMHVAGHDIELFDRIAPGAMSFDAVALADDESVAVFDAYVKSSWDPGERGEPVARIVITR
jgi:glutamate synthase domain-containing protein 2